MVQFKRKMERGVLIVTVVIIQVLPETTTALTRNIVLDVTLTTIIRMVVTESIHHLLKMQIAPDVIVAKIVGSRLIIKIEQIKWEAFPPTLS